MAESRTEPAFMKFLCATMRHCLSDELLMTAPIKSIKSKKFEINLQKGQNQLS